MTLYLLRREVRTRPSRKTNELKLLMYTRGRRIQQMYLVFKVYDIISIFTCIKYGIDYSFILQLQVYKEMNKAHAM